MPSFHGKPGRVHDILSCRTIDIQIKQNDGGQNNDGWGSSFCPQSSCKTASGSVCVSESVSSAENAARALGSSAPASQRSCNASQVLEKLAVETIQILTECGLELAQAVVGSVDNQTGLGGDPM